MAQFIELLGTGGVTHFVRCSSIERVEATDNLAAEAVAPPDAPLIIVLREGRERLPVYGCTVLDVLHGIHRDDCSLASFRAEPNRPA